MSQRLTLPLNDLRVTAGYKNPQYLAYWKFGHYGMDCTSPDPARAVVACGDGEVVACGQDGLSLTGANSRLGNVVVIIYRDVLCNDGKVRHLTCRMYHFASIAVAKGQKVCRGTVVGQYGNTGANTSGPHLHIEFDTDTKFPTLAYGVKVSTASKIINTTAEYQRAGGLADSTVNPAQVWFLGEGQQIKAAASSWTVPGDLIAPPLPQDKPAELQEAVYAFRVYEFAGSFEDAAAARRFAVERENRTLIQMEVV